ncbi:hypothetical protein ACS0TY_014847 [Phlomoides rotata]
MVSNLFFADDTIIFGRATVDEWITIDQILECYEVGRDIGWVLGVRRVEQHAIYLGIPTNVGRSRNVAFRSVVQRVEKKFKDCKIKTLSQAGKLTLIKSVAQSIPIYTMSCFKLPQDVIERIRAVIIRFW